MQNDNLKQKIKDGDIIQSKIITRRIGFNRKNDSIDISYKNIKYLIYNFLIKI